MHGTTKARVLDCYLARFIQSESYWNLFKHEKMFVLGWVFQVGHVSFQELDTLRNSVWKCSARRDKERSMIFFTYHPWYRMPVEKDEGFNDSFISFRGILKPINERWINMNVSEPIGFSGWHGLCRWGGCFSRRETIYPIHVAVMEGDLEIVKMLLEAGVDIEKESSTGRDAIDSWDRMMMMMMWWCLQVRKEL